VKRRGEGHDAEAAHAGRQGFSPLAYPSSVPGASLDHGPGRTGQHLRIGIEADDLVERRRQPEGHRSRPASDIEQPSLPVKGESAGEGVG
jgi:hypothetical protein